MEKKYIILILITILLVILIFFTKCSENFESDINYRPLTTNIFNVLYTIYENNDIVLLTNFNNDSVYAKIYELENILNEKYYNIYLNNEILKYVNGDKIDFYLDSADNISEFTELYRLFYLLPKFICDKILSRIIYFEKTNKKKLPDNNYQLSINDSNFKEKIKYYNKININKLHYTINNQNKFLAIDKNNINLLILSNNEEDGITWNF